VEYVEFNLIKMENEIIKFVENDKSFRIELKDDFKKLNNMSVINKAELSKQLFIDARKFEKAFEIAGDTIYDLTIENEALTEKLDKIGEYDEKEINDFINNKKAIVSNENKNKVIREQLLKTIQKAKSLTDK
jgi:argininosuccinate lyase